MSSLPNVIDVVGCTHAGRRRSNEDAYSIAAQLGLAIVADGVGGHDAGEVASAITCDVVTREVASGHSLPTAIRSASREVSEAVRLGLGKAGMASTVVAVHVNGPNYKVAWVGDSRAYLWNSQLCLLTRDHSFVQALLDRGELSLSEARVHPRKNVIVEAVGLRESSALQVGENSGTLAKGDILLLCTDGLNDFVDTPQLVRILSSGGSLQERCQALLDAAVNAGGGDNITVVLLSACEPADKGTLGDVVWCFDPALGAYCRPSPASPPYQAPA